MFSVGAANDGAHFIEYCIKSIEAERFVGAKQYSQVSSFFARPTGEFVSCLRSLQGFNLSEKCGRFSFSRGVKQILRTLVTRHFIYATLRAAFLKIGTSAGELRE